VCFLCHVPHPAPSPPSPLTSLTSWPLSRCLEFHIYIFCLSGVGLSPLGTAATSGLLYKPQTIDEGDFGAVGGSKIGRGNRSTRRKPVPAPLCPPQIPHDQTRARTWAAAVGSQQLTAWAMAWPSSIYTGQNKSSHRAHGKDKMAVSLTLLVVSNIHLSFSEAEESVPSVKN
jgi:hypothetical protein